MYRWYGTLRTVEQALEAALAAEPAQREAMCREQLARLDEIEELVNQISIPLAFADGLYGLRSHINFVRQRVRYAMGAGGPGPDTSSLAAELHQLQKNLA